MPKMVAPRIGNNDRLESILVLRKVIGAATRTILPRPLRRNCGKAPFNSKAVNALRSIVCADPHVGIARSACQALERTEMRTTIDPVTERIELGRGVRRLRRGDRGRRWQEWRGRARNNDHGFGQCRRARNERDEHCKDAKSEHRSKLHARNLIPLRDYEQGSRQDYCIAVQPAPFTRPCPAACETRLRPTESGQLIFRRLNDRIIAPGIESQQVP